MQRPRSLTITAALPCLVVSLLLAACASSVASMPSTTTTTALSGPQRIAVPQGSTLVATLHGATPGSIAPDLPSSLVVPGHWYGYRSKLEVIGQRPGWLHVRLAQRPNGSTAWIRSSAATVTSTPYRLVVNLSTMHLVVYEHGTSILDFPAGVGTTSDPTTAGDFFITMHAPAPNPGYGPLVLVTSAHSNAITDWQGSGDAIIAIHGPISTLADSQIGDSGARISFGCIRLHDADLAQLAMIPPGTPFDVVN